MHKVVADQMEGGVDLMHTDINRWETGGEFHWLQMASLPEELAFPNDATFYSCGRTALAAILEHGLNKLGWKRLWTPSYNCPDVVNTILSAGIEIAVYPDNPVDKTSVPKDIRQGDVLFVVNYFGLKDAAEYAEFFEMGIPVIEDHTHDPWSQWAKESKADYVIVSLRKTLPIPDGGVLWSNIGSPMPAEPLAESFFSPAYDARLEAMLLKSIYLSGGSPDKSTYLELFDNAKTHLENYTTRPNIGVRGMSRVSRGLLSIFPWRKWRELRQANCMHFHEKVQPVPGIRVLLGEKPTIFPFSLIFVFDDCNLRNEFKKRLIARSIYPAVIWPIARERCPWSDERAVYLSERLLSIHCDGRYGRSDMDRIVAGFSECAY